MKPKPYEAQNTKFSEYQRSLLISYATFELLKFESRTDVIIEISRFLRHRRPGINEGVFDDLLIIGFLFSESSAWRRASCFCCRRHHATRQQRHPAGAAGCVSQRTGQGHWREQSQWKRSHSARHS